MKTKRSLALILALVLSFSPVQSAFADASVVYAAEDTDENGLEHDHDHDHDDVPHVHTIEDDCDDEECTIHHPVTTPDPNDGNPDDGNPDDGNPDDGNSDEGNPEDGAAAGEDGEHQEEHTHTHTITLYLNGGSVAGFASENDQTVLDYTPGTSVELPEAVRAHYTFGGWYTDASYSQRVSAVSEEADGDLSFYAKWNSKTYTVVYDANGGDSTVTGVMKDSVFTYGINGYLTENIM